MKYFYILFTVPLFLFLTTACKGGWHPFPKTEEGGSYDNTNKNASKTIESRDLIFFKYSYLPSAGEESINPYIGPITFTLSAGEKDAQCSGYGEEDYKAFQFDFKVALSHLEELESIVRNNNLARVNGEVRGAIGIPEGLGAGLDVKYASGERIYADVNNESLLSLQEDQEIYNFFYRLAKEEDPGLILSKEEDEELYRTFYLYTGFQSPDRKIRVNIEDYLLKVYEDVRLVIEDSYRISGNRIYRYDRKNEEKIFGYLIWQDGILILVDGEGNQSRLDSMNKESCPNCEELIEINEDLYRQGYLNCPSCKKS